MENRQAIDSGGGTLAGKTAPLRHNLLAGVALISSAFFCAALMSALSKQATQAPPLLLLFTQYAISFLVFLPTLHRFSLLRTRRFPLHLLRSLSGAICQLLFFIAVRSIPLLDAVLLSNAAPLFIPLVVLVWFRKRVQPLVAVSLLIGLAGVVLMLHPGAAMFRHPASAIALAAAFFSALALVATNALTSTEPAMRILLYNFGVATLLLIPLAIEQWRPLSARTWTLLLLIGVLYAATQYLIIAAYRRASASELSPFNYTVVVFSGVLGWLMFGNVPGLGALFGTGLICAGGILSIQAGHVEGLGHGFGAGHWARWRRRLRHPAL